MRTLLRFFASSESGQSLVEFALTLPIVLLVITGTFDVARAVWQENTLAYAAREGTRYAIVHGSGFSPPGDPALVARPPDAGGNHDAGIIAAVRNAAVGVNGVITVTSTWPGPNNCYERNCPVTVVASSQFIPLPSYYMLGSTFQITLRGGSQLVIQR